MGQHLRNVRLLIAYSAASWPQTVLSIAKRSKQHCVRGRPFNEMTAPGSWNSSTPIRIVLEGLRGDDSIAELSRKEGKAETRAPLRRSRRHQPRANFGFAWRHGDRRPLIWCSTTTAC